MNKKIFPILGLSLALAGCGSSDSNENTDQNEANKDPQIEESVDQESIDETQADSIMMSKNEGPMAYDFKMEDLQGEEFKLSDQLGKKVYIKYWASWCPICLDTMDELDQMFAHADDKDYEMVTIVSPGHMGEKDKDDFIAWYEGLGYDNITVLLDESGEFIKDYSIRSTPTNIMVGSDGVLVGVVPGQIGEEGIDQVFEQIQ